MTHLKRPWCWERLGTGGEGNDRGWDGWMASLTQWTWVWVNAGSWWWTGRPGALRFMGSQWVGHDWATELYCGPLLTFMLLWLFKTFWSSQISNTSPAFYAQRMVSISSSYEKMEMIIFCFWPHYGILVPRPGIEPAPSASLHWKCRVLMTEPPGKSLEILIDLISHKGVLLTSNVHFFIPLLFLYSCILSVHDHLFVNVNPFFCVLDFIYVNPFFFFSFWFYSIDYSLSPMHLLHCVFIHWWLDLASKKV